MQRRCATANSSFLRNRRKRISSSPGALTRTDKQTPLIACRYEEDQEFQRQHVELYRVIPGTWYVRLNGDYLGFVRADVLYYLTEEGGNVTSFDIPTEVRARRL